jgi:hypothetical protein
MTEPLILSQITTGTFTINSGTTINPSPSMVTFVGPGTSTVCLSAQSNPNALINMPANSSATLVFTDQSGKALLTITEKPFSASVQQLQQD